MQGSVLRHSTQTFNYMQVCIILLSSSIHWHLWTVAFNRFLVNRAFCLIRNDPRCVFGSRRMRMFTICVICAICEHHWDPFWFRRRLQKWQLKTKTCFERHISFFDTVFCTMSTSAPSKLAKQNKFGQTLASLVNTFQSLGECKIQPIIKWLPQFVHELHSMSVI
jgi:hypothetical protein